MIDNIFKFNITEHQKALESLCNFTGLYEEDILVYLFKFNNINSKDFLDNFRIDINYYPDKDIYLTALHVTTNDDDCESLKKEGLLNL